MNFDARLKDAKTRKWHLEALASELTRAEDGREARDWDQPQLRATIVQFKRLDCPEEARVITAYADVRAEIHWLLKEREHQEAKALGRKARAKAHKRGRRKPIKPKVHVKPIGKPDGEPAWKSGPLGGK